MAACVAAYCVLAALLYWPVLPLSTSRIVTCACDDPVQEVWFLGWPPFALTHLHSLFVTNWVGFPGGVNLVDNTSMPLLGTFVAPLTGWLGPVAAYNFLLRAGFAVSASSAALVLNRWGIWRPAAFIGGLLYGFSPFLIGEGAGHAFLVFAALPPLIFLVLSEVVRGRRRPAWKTGCALGLLASAQFYISAEILISTTLMALVALAGLVLTGHRGSPHSRRHAGACLLWAAGVVVVLTGYAVWSYLAGPQHIVGPLAPIALIDHVRTDLLSAVVPTSSQLLDPSGLVAFGHQVTHNSVEDSSYIGIPLLAMLLALGSRYRDDWRVRFTAGMAVATYILSIGTHLRVAGTLTRVPLPFLLVEHVPLLQGIPAARLSLYTFFFVAVLLGLVVSRLRTELAGVRWLNRNRTGSGRGPALVAVAVASVCLVPLLPHLPAYRQVPTGVPAFFLSPAVDQIPSGSVVLAYPYGVGNDDQAMMWASEAGMRFKLIGGLLYTPGAGGRTRTAPEPLPPLDVESVLQAAFAGGVTPPLDPATEADLRTFLITYGVGVVAIDPIGVDPARVVAYVSSALGAQPRREPGVYLWLDADHVAAKRVAR